MKVAICIDERLNAEAGGAYSYVKALLEGLLKKNSFDTCVIIECHTAPKNGLLSEWRTYATAISFIPHTPKYPLLLRAINRFCKTFHLSIFSVLIEAQYRIIDQDTKKKSEDAFAALVKSNNIDLVYYAEPFKCLSKDVPFYTTVWDLGHLTISQFPEISTSNKYEEREQKLKAILPRAFRIVAESQEGKNLIQKYYNIADEKVVIAPLFPGNSINIIVPESEQSQWLQTKGIVKNSYLFYPAQFWPHKNHSGLLNALLELKTKFSQTIQLVLTGSDKGNLDLIKKKVRDMKLENQVLFLGFVSDKEINILYKNASALLMPTFLGPTNMPVIEAMALGCPVICSNLKGHMEIGQDTFLYFDPLNHSEMAVRINALITDSTLRQSLIERSGNRYQENANALETAVHNIIASFEEFQIVRDCWI